MTADVPRAASLRRQLMLVLIGGAALLAVVLYVFVRLYATQIAQRGQDSILTASVTSILDTAVIRDGALEVDFPYAALSMLSTDADDRVFYAIRQDGTLVSGYETLPEPPDAGNLPQSWSTGFQNADIRLTSAGRRLFTDDRETTISVTVAQTQDALSVTLGSISRTVALFGTGFFILSAGLSFWATASAINPLNRLAQSITRRGPGDLSAVEKPVPSEMAPLVGSLNSLMGRLEQSLARSEDFIAEAAHRVRTPLATVRSHAETTLQRVEKEENRAALRAMIRAIDESSRAAGQLLDHAMTTFRADHLSRQTLNLKDLVADLAHRLEPVAEMKDIAFALQTAPEVEVTADPILLQNAIRNLIDNALKYSPAESEIAISVAAVPRASVSVCDNGPGFPDGHLERLVERFARGENAEGTTGSGLGLTIAQEVALAHGGTLHLENSPEGGACVTLEL